MRMTRWSLDVTVEERRAHVGIETQRHWSEPVIERSTPLLCGLSSLVTLFGQALHPDGQIPVAHAAIVRRPPPFGMCWGRQAASMGSGDVSHITHGSRCGVRPPLFA